VKKHLKTLILMAAFSLVVGTAGGAQEKADKEKAEQAERAVRTEKIVPLRVQVVLSRYQGERKLSSMPHTLTVNASTPGGGVASLRMGAKIPVLMMATPKVDGKDIKELPVGGPVQYHDVGTNMDCRALLLDDGRFRLDLTVDDTSVYADEGGKSSAQPSFRSFRATDSMILRDGQTSTFTSATDKVSGEVTRVDVTVTVIK